MLALRLLKLRLFRATNLVMAFAMAGFIGLTFVLPLYLQGLRGLDPFHSGLTTFPQAIGILISSQIAGRIYPSIGPRRLIVGGMLGAAAAMSCLLLVGLETDLWWIRIIMFLRGFAMGFCFVSSQAASYAEIKPADNGRASAIFSTQRQMAVVDRRRPDGHRAGELHDAERGADRSRPRARSGTTGRSPCASAWRSCRRCWRSLMIHDEDARATMLARRARAAPSPRRPPTERAGGAQPPWTWSQRRSSPSRIVPAATPSSDGERAALVGRDPDVDHRRLVVLDERRAARAVGAA